MGDRRRVGDSSPLASAVGHFGIAEVEVSGFRGAREVAFAPGPLCALVGEANAGKSNLLAAIRAALDPAAAPLIAADAAVGGDGTISISIRLADGGEVALAGTPQLHTLDRPSSGPPVLFLPAAARSSVLLADGKPANAEAARAVDIFKRALSEREPSSGAPALAVVEALEACCASGVRGLVLLIEEPELYLRPQTERYLYRLLRQFADGGNQVIYSTHSPSFLSVARLDELVFIERVQKGTRAVQPRPVTPGEDFRVLTEFDAARSELFLAHAAVLVEGQTEKLALPFVFAALGYDADREAISIVECGGKPNMPLFARICHVASVPFVVVHDSDARPGRKPTAADKALNALIAEAAGSERLVVLEPDFEAVAGLEGHSHKPERAWRRFAALTAAEIPEQLARAAKLAVSLARDR